MDRYVKTRRLDPLESYVPSILLAQSQLRDIPDAVREAGVDVARVILRSGSFDGLRDNIRAVGEYASVRIGKSTAQTRVKAVFAAIEAIDSLLFLVWFKTPFSKSSLPCVHTVSQLDL
jgi:hypothetical protein